eukprot:6584803-Prymnesium_polylepis.1
MVRSTRHGAPQAAACGALCSAVPIDMPSSKPPSSGVPPAPPPPVLASSRARPSCWASSKGSALSTSGSYARRCASGASSAIRSAVSSTGRTCAPSARDATAAAASMAAARAPTKVPPYVSSTVT